MAMANNRNHLVADCTHLGRNVTGIERVTLDLIGLLKDRIDIFASNRFSMVVKQWALLPFLSLKRSVRNVLCFGFPPSMPLVALSKAKVVHYVHDLFLAENASHLSFIGKFYMAPSFKYSLKHSATFLVNSETTRKRLEPLVSATAVIQLARPAVSDVFNIATLASPETDVLDTKLIQVLAIGTVEPRKGLLEAAELCSQLAILTGVPVRFHIVGRRGWGDDWEQLQAMPNVVLHGYASPGQVRQLLGSCPIYIASSVDEGLGLPLLEVQHGGKIVVARDIPVFREVLGDSGVLLSFGDLKQAAQSLLLSLKQKSLPQLSSRARSNVARWNALAAADAAEWLRLTSAAATTPLSMR